MAMARPSVCVPDVDDDVIGGLSLLCTSMSVRSRVGHRVCLAPHNLIAGDRRQPQRVHDGHRGTISWLTYPNSLLRAPRYLSPILVDGDLDRRADEGGDDLRVVDVVGAGGGRIARAHRVAGRARERDPSSHVSPMGATLVGRNTSLMPKAPARSRRYSGRRRPDHDPGAGPPGSPHMRMPRAFLTADRHRPIGTCLRSARAHARWISGS
jgi:hypothetical protein